MDDVIAGERFTALDGGAWDPSIGLHCSPICTFIHGRYPHEYRHTCTTPNRKAAIVHPIAGEHVSRPQCINSCRDADACSSSPVRLGRSWRAHQSTASAHARHASAGQPATGQVARRPPLIAAGQRGASASPAWLCFTVEAQLPDQPTVCWPRALDSWRLHSAPHVRHCRRIYGHQFSLARALTSPHPTAGSRRRRRRLTQKGPRPRPTDPAAAGGAHTPPQDAT